jgi:hypothetical protein
MRCPTGKSAFSSEALALEALVQNHIRHQHRFGAGPLDVYQCVDCNEWHFTSRPPMNPHLLDPEVQQRIKSEGRALEWERKFK